MEENGPREEVIQAAMRTITHGTQEIHATFSQARGPLSKAVIKDIARRVKDLRQTAESAEDAFRDWTVDLSGRPYEKDAKLRYDELRASFEAEVASIQHAMTRVADEVKRRQASKAGQVPAEAVDEECLSSIIPPAAPLPEPTPPPERRAPAPAPVPSAASSSLPPKKVQPPARSAGEARVQSHATIASCLEDIASQERTARQIVDSNIHVISEGHSTSKNGKGEVPKRIRDIHPFMKYIIWVALISLAYVIWTEARYLVANTAHDEALRGARAGHPSALRDPNSRGMR